MRHLRLALLPALVLVPAAAFAGPELDPFARIAIQDGGRTKPLDTFARETAKRLVGAKPFGFESVKGMKPVDWLLAAFSSPERWRGERFIKITHAGLRDAAGLPRGKDLYSFTELVSDERLMGAIEKVHAKLQAEREAKLDPVEKELATLYDSLSLLNAVFTGDAFRIVPHPSDARGTWTSLADLSRDSSPASSRIQVLVTALTSAYRDGDAQGVSAASAALGKRLAEGSTIYPSAADMTREVGYNRTKPFRLAWLCYLFGFLALLASFPLASRPLTWGGMGLAGVGFALHAYGMLLRILISGRPPVTNMYESVIFVAWGAMLFALIFELVYRARYFAVAASALAVICLILADNVPILDGSIDPLVPVLRDNMWLTVHVLTITLGYAAFTLAMGMGHVNLGLHFFAPGKAALLKTLSRFLYRSLQVGTLFLAVGTLLGGVWASYSWGRFWGWDPKETWALIALLGYLAILHGRFVKWISDFGMAVGSILGYLLVLMAWYGVNFVLGTGLHSYGFGSGGYAYVGGFVAFEVLVIVLALGRYRAEQARVVLPSPEAAALSS